MGNRYTIISLIMFLAVMTAQAQIKIGGSVYGGGNAGDVSGNTAVTVYAGDLNEVFGGARQANVGGHAFTHINGEEASDYILINRVYGGNDISGQIGSSEEIPTEIKQAGTNGVDNTWNAFVRVSSSNTEEQTDQKGKVYLGQLFGGGNGAYDYTSEKLGDGETDNPYYNLKKPELGKTYLEIVGGSMVYAFGGGNNATVTDKTVIYVNNTSPVVNSVKENGNDLLTDTRLAEMGFNPGYTYPTSAAFQIGSFFGGNNLEAMHIRPQWNLQKGKIRNLYSGGNRGAMTSPVGLLLEINPNPEGTDDEKKQLVIDNIYGGCRMADIHPLTDAGDDVATDDIQLSDSEGYTFPAGLSARVLVRGGDINNVYGGNDITGHVYGGNAVGVYTSIRGDVYGGGNGAYPYTDNPDLKNHPTYGDLYYTIPEGKTSVDALNAFRPNAEQVSLRLYGKEDKPTIIGGSVYVGGNCATLATTKAKPMVELKVGSYVYADDVFLGNNGEGMVQTHEKVDGDEEKFHDGVLRTYKSTSITSDGSKFNSMDLTVDATFDKYMDGVVMELMPSVVFDSKANGDPDDYAEYTTYFGSFYCGGNIGSMRSTGKTTINFSHQIIIFNKLVGGSNNADVGSTEFNAAYSGGLLGEPDTNGDKLELNLLGLKIQPKRWVDENNKSELLEWNTIKASTGEKDSPVTDGASEESPDTSTDDDKDRRLTGGNIYGGCYNSGHINGNVIININETLMERDSLFDVVSDEGDCLYENTMRGSYNITKRNTGVILSEQGMDVLGAALNVFGGGYGKPSEIWGSTTINLNKGYVFQIFGGGEAGAIGKKEENGEYSYDSKYSTYINLNGSNSGVARGATGDSPDMAECEFIYGGGFEGTIAGDTHVNLGNGRIFNSFAGSCNADILGHTETYMGQWTEVVGETETTKTGFPWIRDHIYGGNDLGGSIKGYADFTGRIRGEVKDMVYEGNKPEATVYMEYTQGRVMNIFGGCYGDYDYLDPAYVARIAATKKPYLHNAFVNIRPLATSNMNNKIERIFGAGEGYTGEREGDKSQDYSYVLIDIPDGIEEFKTTEVFGAGAYDGLGMRWTAAETFQEDFDLIEASAVIDLMRGRIGAAYGGSLDEGITRRTMVNVPSGSTIIINNIFGGAYGKQIFKPCDVYEANVNYRSADARVNGKIYGGNNNVRRTIYATVNINVPVLAENGYYGTVFGAGKGLDTWAEYTEVNLEDRSQVYEVYGGSEEGNVLNAESVEKYMQTHKDKTAWTIDGYYNPNDDCDNYVTNDYTNLTNAQFVRTAEMDDRDYTGYSDDEKAKRQYRYNTNVIINEGATVSNYAYGGGYGKENAELSGGVYGTTYIALLGGKVNKDIYAACTSGQVTDFFAAGAYDSSANQKGFTASANAYIKGGTCRNVYGAGWKGKVGSETLDGETHVVIGNKTGTTFIDGIPAIQRNAYAGGEGETTNGVTEGSAVYGTANITLYNGYIGYTYNVEGTDDEATTDIDERYEEKLHDETATEYVSDDGIVGKNRLVEAGNIFGSGYVDHSDVDRSYVTIYGGVVRNSLYGGGEIGCVGRGSKDGSTVTITKGGATHVSMYGGLVIGDVFGGGRGYDNMSRVGTLGTAGYIFGTTEVNIHRGRIGTIASVAEGRGNVFGGGNLGYVYGTGTKSASDGYYYENGSLTEDCKVVVSPYVLVTGATAVNGHSYDEGDYVPTADLNTLTASDSNWKTDTGGNFDDMGITIGNAVFAGGNVSAGSDEVYANTNTVYGNATASVTDVFNKDLIAIGGDGVGGLYGDGNLTLVDGYRELNITNYGTDYYNLNSSISYDDYQKLNDRERAYFELQYRAKSSHTYSYYRSTSYHNYDDVTYYLNQKITAADYAALSSTEQANWILENKTYTEGDKINEEDFELMDSSEQSNWELLGFCTLYAGRIMNTIQRADFCGVFGSRIVLRGAQDRVPSVVDYTNYTINRVDEVSLNQVTNSSFTHGNYFGIYSVVNFLGALTSDVKFSATRTTESGESQYAADGSSYYDWKQTNLNNRKRNNGSSANEVALSSGVWLEILDKRTETSGYKVYGPVTGVVELALINVATGEGGGYVYAKNMHGALSSDISAGQVTLSTANTNAVSYKQYTYEPVTSTDKMQTSGNFVNSVKRIVDDCFPQSGSFYGGDAAPAHYWYIRGEFYLYDQYISAYTGSAQAYAEHVSIPLTITPESQGRLTLKDVRENLYAYWTDSYENLNNYKSQVDDDAIIINDITYHKNDPISYWEYSRLNDAQKAFFLDKTYVSMEDMTLSNVTYTKGQVLTTVEYNAVPADEYVCTTAFTATGGTEYEHGKVLTETEYEALAEEYKQYFESAKSLVHVSNALSHDNGFLLSFAWDNPDIWNNYYQHSTTGDPQYVRSTKYDSDEFESSRTNYIPSPTFKCNATGVYGQLNYQTGNLIDEHIFDRQSATSSHLTPERQAEQAKFEKAYVAKENCDFIVGGVHYNYVAGAPISKTLYDSFDTYKSHFETGYICIRTYMISDTEFIMNGDVMTETAYNGLTAEQREVLSPVYICTQKGAWGGDYFEDGKNYSAVEFSNLSKAERVHFSYNYDALDLLSEDFAEDGVSEKKYQGETHGITNQIPYCEKQPIDYTATYGGAPKELTATVEVKRGSSTTTTNRLETGDVLTSTVYESLVNEQFHYSPIVVSGADPESTVYYVVKEGFQVSDIWYNAGNKMSAEIYTGLTQNQKDKVAAVSRSSLPNLPNGNETKNYYFCTSPYEAKTLVKDVTNNTYAIGNTVPLGTIIGPEDNEGYGALKNEQTGFTIDGIIPTETSTLYVSREVDINDLSQDKIVTVEYWYEYIESDETGNSYETIRERHVVNIRIHFESGVPVIGELLPPNTVLPGDVLGLNQPTVTKGAYEILGGGWETYGSFSDAINHKNGTPYNTNLTPMYWYQDGNYVAYYAKTYLGKTYSNAVQISVANYHDMDKVMADKDHHMYVDNPRVKRNPKIYIDNRECASDQTKSELDLFYDFFTLSTISSGSPTGALAGHELLNTEQVGNCRNLDFILYSDVAPKAYTTWNPIGTDANCFEGWLHGNGYTVSGLTNSLFGTLCGNIYNIGVMGSFTNGGVANSGSGHIENTWVSTTATPLGNPIIGDVTGSPYVYNSYYPKEQNWTAHTAPPNLNIIEKPTIDFVNGQVAYLLNSNYLQARYLLFGNKSNAASGNDKRERPVFFSYPDGTFDVETTGEVTKNKEYTISYTTNSSEWAWHSGNGFVEDYMGTGDFRYSDGIIPKQSDVSYTMDEDGNEIFVPVFPDDYIYFGQVLSYDLYNSTDRPVHDMHPMGIEKYHTTQSGDDVDNSKHLLLNIDAQKANRVFRAPAYFRNGTYGESVTFNASAAFAGSYTKDAVTYQPHEGLTAIDFTGKGDITGYSGVVPGNESDFKSHTAGYGPLLDYYGLSAIRTSGITKNLLTYAPTADAFTETSEGAAKAQTAATETLGVLSNYFNDPVYSETDNTYRTVDVVAEVNMPMGHLVQMGGGFGTDNRVYTTVTDHFLVDKQDFNAPISYTFGSGKRMWYQRTPERYVSLKDGWETVSLPFTAELVTTQQKGEITHFYTGSHSVDGETKIGHEYWLREYKGKKSQDGDILTAIFNFPDAAGGDKSVSNTFLWDYYYQQNERQDANADTYQTYYSDASRNYLQYPLLSAGSPYIIGFPGKTYYEFDLSGEWTAKNTVTPAPAQLDRQVITFASETGFQVKVSDEELVSKTMTEGGYSYVPNYMSKTVSGYLMHVDGNQFRVAADILAVPFRPYFVTTAGSRQAASRILFDSDESSFAFGGDHDPSKEEIGEGDLLFTVRKHEIVVTSSLRHAADVRIVNVSGITVANFTIQPGETIERYIPIAGVYVVRADGGRIQKKIALK